MTPNYSKAHAKLLSELARSGLEVEDPAVRDKYDEFRLDVTRQAMGILKDRIPSKILHFNNMVREGTKDERGYLHADDLKEFEIPADFKLDEALRGVSTAELVSAVAADSGRPAKRTKRDSSSAAVEAGTTATGGMATALGGVVYPQGSPLQPQIVELGALVRNEALALIEMIGIVKLWIQLNVPRIEDGNNFGVAIQEEAIGQIDRVEDSAFSLCDGIKYHMARAKLMSKLLKYPRNADYKRCIREVDIKEWLHLKISVIDMRNSYSMLYDLLHKNWEKVVKPKNSDGSMMVM